MKYYSEVLHKTFDTVKELEEAEGKEKFRLVAKANAEEHKKERKKTLVKKAKEDYDEAVRKYNAARNEYDRALEAYLRTRKAYYELVDDERGQSAGDIVGSLWKQLFEEYF